MSLSRSTLRGKNADAVGRRHTAVELEKVALYGLLYTWKGSDESLKPIVRRSDSPARLLRTDESLNRCSWRIKMSYPLIRRPRTAGPTLPSPDTKTRPDGSGVYVAVPLLSRLRSPLLSQRGGADCKNTASFP